MKNSKYRKRHTHKKSMSVIFRALCIFWILFLSASMIQVMAQETKEYKKNDTQTSEKSEDRYDQALLKLSLALENVPEKYRGRIKQKIIPAIIILTYPEVANKVGEIVSIKTKWEERSAKYSIGKVKGEYFKCSIEMSNLNNSLSGSWASSFPFRISSPAIRYANINIADILTPVFQQLPTPLLKTIAIESDNSGVGLPIVDIMTDQDVLTIIALEGTHYRVRESAVEKLTDQDLLARIVLEDEEYRVGSAAVDKLTDQELLTRIAVETEEWGFGRSIVQKLTNQDLLARIAMEAKGGPVRQKAAKKLTDQTLLAKVATECHHDFIRLMATSKLIDQDLLARIAKEDEYWSVRRAAIRKLNNQDFLEKIVKEGQHGLDRDAAQERLEELRTEEHNE